MIRDLGIVIYMVTTTTTVCLWRCKESFAICRNENCLSACAEASFSSALLQGGTFSFYDIRNVKKEVYGMCVTGSRSRSLSFPFFLILLCAERKRRTIWSRTDGRPHEMLLKPFLFPPPFRLLKKSLSLKFLFNQSTHWPFIYKQERNLSLSLSPLTLFLFLSFFSL